jgi:hypothetical protein
MFYLGIYFIFETGMFQSGKHLCLQVHADTWSVVVGVDATGADVAWF